MTTINECTARFFRAAEQGYFHVAKMLLDAGADISARGECGESVLHTAAGDGQEEMVEYLLPLVGKVDVADDDGCTPLHWAARRHQVSVARMLLNHGASPKKLDKTKRTPLHACIGPSESAPQEHRSDCDVAELLLECKANVNAKDAENQTPLHIAAEHGHVEMAAVLLEAGAKVDAINKNGETPLHLAAVGVKKDLLKTLLEAGADVNAVDDLGRTPIHHHLAARPRRKEILQFLLNNGANACATDHDGRTCLDEATDRNPRDPLAELLRAHGAS